MTGHLPECPHAEPDLNPGFLVMCICDRLRACERRVREDDKNTFLRAAYDTGREDGIRDAYDAVDKGGRAAAQIEALAHLRSVTL